MTTPICFLSSREGINKLLESWGGAEAEVLERYKDYDILITEGPEVSLGGSVGMTFKARDGVVVCRTMSKKTERVIYAVSPNRDQALFLLKNLIDEGEPSNGSIGAGVSVEFLSISIYGAKPPKPFEVK